MDELPPRLSKLRPTAVSADLLRSIAEEYVLREGTDYGAVEVGLDSKVDQVLA